LKRTLICFTSQEIVTFSWAVGNGTSTTSVSFLLLQETTKQQYRRIKIDTFLINGIIFQEGINYFYVLLLLRQRLDDDLHPSICF
jgi:hypothetical protein